MANGKIESQDILDPKLKKDLVDYDNQVIKVSKSLKDVYETSKILNSELLKGALNQEKLNQAQSKTEQSAKKLEQEEQKLANLKKQQEILENRIIKQIEEKNKKTSEQIKLDKEQEKISKAQQLSLIALNGSYKQINAALQANILKYQNLSKEERENSKIGGELIKTIQRQDKSLKELDSNMGRHNRNVGNYKSSIIALASAFGLTGGLYAFANVIKNSFNEIKDFSKALSELQAITGVTGKDLIYLKRTAISLGIETGKSGKDIVEAFKLVASAKPELLTNVSALKQTTEAVIILSKASGLDLATSTTALTQIMNQFGVSANEVTRYINTLGAGAKYGAVEIPYLNEAIVKVGNVANTAGLTIEQLTAIIEIFGEKGIQAEIAGTGFKKLLVELQKDSRNYTNGVFDLTKAFENNLSISKDNIALQEKFGEHYFNLAGILFQNRNRFEELTKQITGTNVAFEQAAINTDNLTGDINKSTSAWDALILSIDSGDGVLSRVSRTIVQAWTGFLDLLTWSNKTRAEIEELVQQDQIADAIKEDIKELEEFGKTNKKVYGESMIVRLQNANKQWVEQIELLKQERNQLLQNKDTQTKTLDDNTNNIKAYQNYIERDEKRIAALKEYLSKKQTEVIEKKTEKQKDINEKAREADFKKGQDWLDKTLSSENKSRDEANRIKEEKKQEHIDNILAWNEQQIADEEAAQEEHIDNILAWNEQQADDFIENEKRKQEAIQKTLEISQAGFELFQTLQDREISDLENKRDYDLSMAGNNAKAKERIEKEYAARIAKIKQKQAIASKVEGLFNIGINTATGITKALAEANIPLSILIGVLGGLQAATVIAKPIPKFFKGVENLSKDTMAFVGERGWELGETKNHEYFITPDTATRMMLPKGTTIHPHEESKRMVNDMIPNIDVSELIKEQRLTRKALYGKQENNWHIDGNGWRYTIKRNLQRTTYLDRYFRN